MSCDWNIKCLDCDETLHFNDANHQDKLMTDIIRHRDAIVAIAPLLKSGDVELRTYYGQIDTDWFFKHRGHRLRPIDEYGALLGQCNERVTCSCGAQHRCKLDVEHEGAHV